MTATDALLVEDVEIDDAHVPAYGDEESADREEDRVDWPDGEVPR
jgi:hypothetical protein